MTQGGKKISNIRPGEVRKSGKSAKAVKQMKKAQQAKKGNPTQAPKGRRLDEETEMDLLLSKAIDKSNEKKVAAKALQSGVRVHTKDLLAGGKELNREERRKLLKNKVSRVEQKLRQLEKKTEETEGLL